MSHPRTARRSPVPVAGLVLLVFILVGCVPTGERPELVDEYLDDQPGEVLAPECPQPGEPFEMFHAATVTVLGPDGAVARCVLVADTIALRQRGLSEVEHLGGYAGMVFAFAEESTGSFWMSNTYIPLTIAFVDRNGHVVSTADMDPCPEAVDCPFYFPDNEYLWALEVPQGGLGDFGLVEGASFDPTTLPSALE